MSIQPSASSDFVSRKVGALWIKTSGAGNKYLSGQIEIKNPDGTVQTIYVNVLKTTFRAPGDKKPDYEIVLQAPKVAKTAYVADSLDPESGL